MIPGPAPSVTPTATPNTHAHVEPVAGGCYAESDRDADTVAHADGQPDDGAHGHRWWRCGHSRRNTRTHTQPSGFSVRDSFANTHAKRRGIGRQRGGRDGAARPDPLNPGVDTHR